MSWLEEAKEWIRPYYLRWIYFPLSPGARPAHFTDCWRYPNKELSGPDHWDEWRGTGSASPDIVWYPMTDWHVRMQRSQQLARAFARLGARNVYLNPNLGREFERVRLFDRRHRLSRLEKNIFELHVRLPREPVFHHRLLRDEENDVLVSSLGLALGSIGAGSVAQVLSLPVWLDAARRLRQARGYPIVYDCHDLLSGFSGIAEEIVAREKEMFREADAVLFSSQNLLDRHTSGDPELRAKSALVRNGVNADFFTPPRDGTRPGPVAVYVGAMEEWFDAQAVRRSAIEHPECRFLLVGQVDNARILEELHDVENIEFRGEVPYETLPELLAECRVGLIPFRMSELTLATNPIKLYEYFSCGLPVVGSRLPEIECFGNLVYPASGEEEFSRQVSAALAEDDAERRARRREIAVREGWEARAQAILAMLGERSRR